MTFRTIFVALAMVMTIAVSTASAAVVTSWNYNYRAGFTDLVFEDDGDDYDLERYVWLGEKGHRSVSWGDDDGDQSKLELFLDDKLYTFPNIGTVDTNGDAAYAMTMKHTNMPITGDSLISGTVKAILDLSAKTPFAGPSEKLSAELEFKFYETPNGKNNAPDIFILTNPGVATEGFEYQGEWYTLDFSSNFGVIEESYVTALKLDPKITYYGWVTPENAVTSVDTYFTISHTRQPTPTPEPATLGLMGLGLVGLGLYSRMNRKKAKQQ